MIPRRSPVLKWSVLGIAIVVLLLPTGLAGHGLSIWAGVGGGHTAAKTTGPHSISASARPARIVSVEMPGTLGIGFLASHGRSALTAYILSNGSTELARFDSSTNQFVPLQDLGGGFSTSPQSIIFGGDRYLVSVYNFTSGIASFETYSTAKGIQAANIAVDPSLLWMFDGVGGGLVFLSATGHLLGLNPRTLSVVSDFSALLPVGAGTFSIAGDGPNVYVGGSLQVSASSSEFLYGVLHLRTGTYTQLSPNLTPPPGIFGLVTSVAIHGDRVFFGGQQSFFQNGAFFTTGGLIVAYDTETGGLTDLSGFLPAGGAVEQVLAIGSTIGLEVLNFSFSPSFYEVPGFFEVEHGLEGLLNLTSITGPQFAVAAEESSVSGGLVFMGGLNLSDGNTELEYATVAYLSSFVSHDE